MFSQQRHLLLRQWQFRQQIRFHQPLLFSNMAPRMFYADYDPKEDYWKVLKIREGASTKEVKFAYYKLAKKIHPDKTDGKTTVEF